MFFCVFFINFFFFCVRYNETSSTACEQAKKFISFHECLEYQVIKDSESKVYFLRLFQLFFVIYNYCKKIKNVPPDVNSGPSRRNRDQRKRDPTFSRTAVD